MEQLMHLCSSGSLLENSQVLAKTLTSLAVTFPGHKHGRHSPDKNKKILQIVDPFSQVYFPIWKIIGQF